jgi:molybdopterin-binding protein
MYLMTFFEKILIKGEELMKISARNQLAGKVKKITDGAVNSEVILELTGGQEVVAIITKESVQSLGLKVGKTAYAIIKASSIMVGIEHKEGK